LPFNKTTCIPCKNYIPLAGINRDTLKDNLKDPVKKDMYISGLVAYERVFNLANMHDAFAPGQLNFGGDDNEATDGEHGSARSAISLDAISISSSTRSITIGSRNSSAVDPKDVSDELVRGGELLPLRDVVIISSSSAASSAVDLDGEYVGGIRDGNDMCTECGWIGPAIDVGVGMCIQCMV